LLHSAAERAGQKRRRPIGTAEEATREGPHRSRRGLTSTGLPAVDHIQAVALQLTCTALNERRAACAISGRRRVRRDNPKAPMHERKELKPAKASGLSAI